MPSNKKRLHIIVNPKSGVGKHNLLESYLEKHLDKATFDLTIKNTLKPGDAKVFSGEAAATGVDYVVAAGGDGTINEVARELIGSNTALGIIPIGSGNGLAHHLKIPLNPAAAIDIINKQNVKRIDTVHINNQLFVSIAGVGFDAKVARRFAKSKQRGFLSYFKIVSQEYTSYKPQKYTIELDDKKFETEALLIGFANSNQFGYNTQISPGAKIDDGLIDVCIVKKAPLIELPRIAHLLYWGQIDKSRYVEIIQTKEIRVHQKKNKNINLDGETIRLGKELRIRINPLSLKILTPQKS